MAVNNDRSIYLQNWRRALHTSYRFYIMFSGEKTWQIRHIVSVYFMSRLQNSSPETVSELMDRSRIPEMLTSLRMALLEFMRCRKGLWYTVIDDTEWTEELFDSLIAGADLGDAIIYLKVTII